MGCGVGGGWAFGGERSRLGVEDSGCTVQVLGVTDYGEGLRV